MIGWLLFVAGSIWILFFRRDPAIEALKAAAKEAREASEGSEK